jgi:DNA-binding NarL/FixJ family response regulator
VRILIIDQERDFRRWLACQVGAVHPEAAVIDHDPSSGERLPPDFDPARWDLVFVDQSLVGTPGMEWVETAPGREDLPPVLVLTPPNDQAAALRAIEAGAADFLPREATSHEHIRRVVREALRRGRRTLTRPAGQARGGEAEAGAGEEFSLKGHRFVRTIAEGPVSSVYLMQHEARGDVEVVKVFRQVPDLEQGPALFQRFLREYEAISGIRHPNLVRINDLGVADDLAYIAMEYFPGGHLGDRIARGMTPGQALDALGQIASALGAVHAVGVLHRDLKPGNVMLRSDGSLALIDFGLAKLRDTGFELTKRGEIFGTPYYMSPEQGHGQPVDERSDLYSAGVVLYEMLTGRKPYVAASPMSIIWKHHHAPLPRLPQGIGGLQGLVNGLMAKSPEERFPSAEAVIEAVRAARGAPPPADEAPGTTAEGTLQAPDVTEEAN